MHVLVVGTLGCAALIALQRISDKRTLSKTNAVDFLITSPSVLRAAGFSLLEMLPLPRQFRPSLRRSGFGSFEGLDAIILKVDGKLAVVDAAQAGGAGALPQDLS